MDDLLESSVAVQESLWTDLDVDRVKQTLREYADDSRLGVKIPRRPKGSTRTPSQLEKGLIYASEAKNQQVGNRRELLGQYYTDIFAHNYDPYNGSKLAIGTTKGYLSIVSQYSSSPPILEQRLSMLDQKPITALHWGVAGICMTSGKYFRIFKTSADDAAVDSTPALTFMTPSDIYDVCNVREQPEKVALVCKFGKTRIYDISSQKLLHVLADHKMNATVCRSSGNYIVTGGKDGNVFVYDAHLRSVEPIWNFHQERPVTAVAVSGSATYIAIAQKGLNTPSLFNLRAHFPIGAVTMPDELEIKTMALDDYGGTYWGGSNGVLYFSENSSALHHRMEARYGEKKIRCINSITLPPNRTSKFDNYVSIGGDGNSILISNYGCKYWAYMIHLVNETNSIEPERMMVLL